MQKIIFRLSIVIILFAIIATSVGLFWENDGEEFYIENVNGDIVEIFGNGIYEHESSFKAPINKGTDAVILFVLIPIFFITVMQYRKNSLRLKILHLGLLSCLLYYSASMGFGAAYNRLFLIYIILFSSCLFAFIIGLSNFEYGKFKENMTDKMPYKSVIAFLILAGLSVFVWLIEIIASIKTGTPPGILGINTTEPTFLIDIGIIGPCAFYSAFLVVKRKSSGYVFATILLILNAVIGIIVVFQTIFQRKYGVIISVKEFIPFVGVFVLMSFIAIFITIKILRNIKD